MMPFIPAEWVRIKAATGFSQISTTGKKVKTKDCLKVGKFPVIDQGQSAVAGYADDPDKLITISKPIIVFGDHTRAIKWVDFDFVPGADGTKVLQPDMYLLPRFAYFQMRALEIPDKGYSRHFKFLKELDFAIPPLAEQKVIADKLDTLLAQVDSTKARLERIPEILKRFRQSVLASAVSGRLTEDWRNEHGISIAGWKQMGIGDVAIIATGKTPSRKEPKYWQGGEIPWLTSASTGGIYTNSAEQYVTQSAVAECSLKIFPPGTLLLAMYGEGKTRGQVTELNISAACNQACAAVTANEKKILRGYLKLRLLENYEETRKAAAGGAQPNLNLNKVREIGIAVPNQEEQTEIVRRVDQLFAYADTVERQVNSALERVNQLTQSILARAFRGELTAQWREDHPELISGDNSAEALLERIQAERAAQAPTKRIRKKATV